MNNLRQHTTVTEELGKPQSEWDEVRSTKEAKRLAFDIFWNARADYSRYIALSLLLLFHTVLLGKVAYYQTSYSLWI